MLKIITTTALAILASVALVASPVADAKGKGKKATPTKAVKNWPSKAPKAPKK